MKNPFSFEGAKEIVGKATKAVHGINPYEEEVDDKYANLSPEDDAFNQEVEE